MANYYNYRICLEFETYLSNYKNVMNGHSEIFMNNLSRWHKSRKLRDNIGDALAEQIRIRAGQLNPIHPSPYAFLRNAFKDYPVSEELTHRFLGSRNPAILGD